MNDLDDRLLPDISEKLMGFLCEIDGEYQVKNNKGFVDFFWSTVPNIPFSSRLSN